MSEEQKNLETDQDSPLAKTPGSEKRKNPRFLVYFLVAAVSGFIFLCWLYLMPYILRYEKRIEAEKNNLQKINEEATDTLKEIKEIINDAGDKMKELNQATSTQAATADSQEVNIELLKEKILDYKNQEK